MMEVFEEGVGEGRREAAVADARSGLSGGTSSRRSVAVADARSGLNGGASSRSGIMRGRI